MSAESEVKEMAATWNKALACAGRSGLAVEVTVKEFADERWPFIADMSLWYRPLGRLKRRWYAGPLICVPPRRTAEDAYAELLRLYGRGEHFKSTTVWNYFDDPKLLFPACSSAAELRLRMEVAGMISEGR